MQSIHWERKVYWIKLKWNYFITFENRQLHLQFIHQLLFCLNESTLNYHFKCIAPSCLEIKALFFHSRQPIVYNCGKIWYGNDFVCAQYDRMSSTRADITIPVTLTSHNRNDNWWRLPSSLADGLCRCRCHLHCSFQIENFLYNFLEITAESFFLSAFGVVDFRVLHVTCWFNRMMGATMISYGFIKLQTINKVNFLFRSTFISCS